ncbi:MAG: bifunctional 5,10-methylenetetrahydrofolate dehydrogenase/5,10-methenyltetrahydrofolate cyclohydrolase [Candidatus Thermoplasmatota archaeon]
MTAHILYGKNIAQNMKNTVAEEIQLLKRKYSLQPKITTIIIGDNPSSQLYLKLRDKACEEVGIHSDHLFFDETASEDTVISTIHTLNKKKEIHGILIQYPVPKHISQQALMCSIDPAKDVEGFHPYNIGQLLLGNETLAPCTPRAVIELLSSNNILVEGKHIAIINHSIVVGKPLSILLLNRNATVTVCHVFTKNLSDVTKTADIIISAVGKPKLIQASMVKNDSIVIDVGIVQTPDGVCGDVDFEMVKEKAAMITPVPGGIGPITIACALQNMIATFEQCMQQKKKK